MVLKNIKLVSYVSLAWFAFQTYIIFIPSQPLIERPTHLLFALTISGLVFLQNQKYKIIPSLFLSLIFFYIVYFIFSYERISTRIELIDEIFIRDKIFGFILILILMYGVLKNVGLSLVLVISFFLFYSIYGNLFPGWLNFRGFNTDEFFEILILSTRGVYGITTQTSLYFVFYFIIFGVFYSSIGGSKFLIDIGLFCSKNSYGGSAKSAIISSSLMGSITGSAVANVTSTGVFTIPLMKSGGYSKEKAASIEAVSSTGGQLMPPVMGIAAFVMAELMMVEYTQILYAAIIPAIAFYSSIYLSIHFNAKKQKIGFFNENINLNFKKNFFLLIPPSILIIMLLQRFSPPYCAFFASVSCVFINFLKKDKKNINEYLKFVTDGCIQASKVAVPIAAIGIIVAICIQSNIALKFSSTLISSAQGDLWISLIIIIFGCLIMGMGLPTVASYVIGAVFFVPALKELGFPEMSSHLFVMYYCVLSMITPPVALASYAAAGIAGSGNFKTSIEAFKLSFVIFLIPLCFLFNETILFQNFNIRDFIFAIIGIVTLVISWVAFLEGYLFTKINLIIRLFFLFIVLFLIISKFQTTYILETFLLFLFLCLLNFLLKYKKKKIKNYQN